ncbi:hypothetical protein CDAR_541081 [Caerostris darwini]|uniref:Uncharacterized protein n=1 Tax=Caerostris darwini TaxID=1538125 RepID=A0AAV4UUY0_9ARAC|nr:hypothetical protein CDAR_541081 [Caerostris darwini]
MKQHHPSFGKKKQLTEEAISSLMDSSTTPDPSMSRDYFSPCGINSSALFLSLEREKKKQKYSEELELIMTTKAINLIGIAFSSLETHSS